MRACRECGGRMARPPYEEARARHKIYLTRCEVCGWESVESFGSDPRVGAALAISDAGFFAVMVAVCYAIAGLSWCASRGWAWLPIVVALPAVGWWLLVEAQKRRL